MYLISARRALGAQNAAALRRSWCVTSHFLGCIQRNGSTLPSTADTGPSAAAASYLTSIARLTKAEFDAEVSFAVERIKTVGTTRLVSLGLCCTRLKARPLGFFCDHPVLRFFPSDASVGASATEKRAEDSLVLPSNLKIGAGDTVFLTVHQGKGDDPSGPAAGQGVVLKVDHKLRSVDVIVKRGPLIRRGGMGGASASGVNYRPADLDDRSLTYRLDLAWNEVVYSRMAKALQSVAFGTENSHLIQQLKQAIAADEEEAGGKRPHSFDEPLFAALANASLSSPTAAGVLPRRPPAWLLPLLTSVAAPLTAEEVIACIPQAERDGDAGTNHKATSFLFSPPPLPLPPSRATPLLATQARNAFQYLLAGGSAGWLEKAATTTINKIEEGGEGGMRVQQRLAPVAAERPLNDDEQELKEASAATLIAGLSAGAKQHRWLDEVTTGRAKSRIDEVGAFRATAEVTAATDGPSARRRSALSEGEARAILQELRSKGLNETQQAAVLSSLANVVSLVAGPPGTGKTVTASHLIRAFLAVGRAREIGGPLLPHHFESISSPSSPAFGARQGSGYQHAGERPRKQRVLAVASSNAAADQLLEGLVKAGVRNVVRIGDNVRMRPAISHLSIRSLTQNHMFTRAVSACLERTAKVVRDHLLLADHLAASQQTVKQKRDEQSRSKKSAVKGRASGSTFSPSPVNPSAILEAAFDKAAAECFSYLSVMRRLWPYRHDVTALEALIAPIARANRRKRQSDSPFLEGLSAPSQETVNGAEAPSVASGGPGSVEGFSLLVSVVETLVKGRPNSSHQIRALKRAIRQMLNEASLLEKRLQRSIVEEDADVVVTTAAGAGHDLLTNPAAFVSPSESRGSGRGVDPTAEGVDEEGSESPLLPGSLLTFDLVLVDESSQLVEPQLLVPLSLLDSHAGSLVLVGDDRQLPPVLASESAARAAAFNAARGSSDSLFSRLLQAGKEDSSSSKENEETQLQQQRVDYSAVRPPLPFPVPLATLARQYRSHPAIASWPSFAVYSGKVKSDPAGFLPLPLLTKALQDGSPGIPEALLPRLPRGLAWPKVRISTEGLAEQRDEQAEAAVAAETKELELPVPVAFVPVMGEGVRESLGYHPATGTATVTAATAAAGASADHSPAEAVPSASLQQAIATLVASSDEALSAASDPLATATTPSRYEEDDTSRSNLEEAKAVVRVVKALLSSRAKADDEAAAASTLSLHEIGVITPYLAQVRAIGDMLRKEGFAVVEGLSHVTLSPTSTSISRTDEEEVVSTPEGGGLGRRGLGGSIEVRSVDSYQGREKAIIIFSAVRSNERGAVGFLADWRRTNVSLTRAKHGLVVIGDPRTLSHDPVWRSFLDFCRLNGLSKSLPELTGGRL